MITFGEARNIARPLFLHPLARRNPARPICQFLWWQLRSRLQREVIVPWVSGTRLAVMRGMTGATGNIYVGLHEFYDMALVLHFLRPGDLFLDIGANVGSYTVLGAGACGTETWAFEPDPDATDQLRRNISVNDLGNRTVVHQLAIGDCDDVIPFSVGRDTEKSCLPDRRSHPRRSTDFD